MISYSLPLKMLGWVRKTIRIMVVRIGPNPQDPIEEERIIIKRK